MARPYTILSVATSIDGYMDDITPNRIGLSNKEDLDRVDAVRDGVDAIMVGADTIRTDNPQLVVRSPQRHRDRVAANEPASPLKITLTTTGDLDPGARLFTAGDCDKIVYTTTRAVARTRARLGHTATIVPAGDHAVDLPAMLADLAYRGIARLMVEGGAKLHTQLLTAGLVDQLDHVIAPFILGTPRAPRFPGPGAYPYAPDHPLTLTKVTQIGSVALLQYHGITSDNQPDEN